MKVMKFRVFSLFVLLTLLLSSFGTVFAQDSTPVPPAAERVVFGIKNADPMKSWFTFETTPGQEMKDTAIIINETKSREIGVNLNVYDGRSIQTTGGSSFYADEPGTGVASWITVEKTGKYRVPADNGVEVPFSVKVPEGTKTGEYFAMMMVQLTDPAPGEENMGGSVSNSGASSFSISIVRQAAVAIVIRVKGQEEFAYKIDVPDCQVRAENDNMAILMHTVNIGNEGWAKSESGKISFKIRQANEQQTYLATFDKTMGYLGFGHEIKYPIRLDKPLDAGDYAADIVMQMDEKKDPTVYKFTCKFTVTQEQAAMVKPTPTPAPTLKPGQIPTPPPMTLAYFIRSNPLIFIGIGIIFLILIIVIILLVSKRRKDEDEEDEDE